MGYLARFALTIGAAALFAGCGAQGGTTLPQRVGPQSSAHKASGSSDDLLYVVGYSRSSCCVSVYSYTTQQYLMTLDDSQNANNLCADKQGNVYFTEINRYTYQVVEYKRGAAKPKRSLSMSFAPNACAIDPITGDLAVTTQSPYVYVFKHAKGVPKMYSNPNMVIVFGCTYDSSGNLYVTGAAYKHSSFTYFRLSVMPRHRKRLEWLRKDGIPDSGYDDVKWDGSYVAVYDGGYIYRLAIHGKHVTVEGKIYVNEFNRFTVVPKYEQMVTADDFGNVNYYTYPGGALITSFNLGAYSEAYAVAVSLAPSPSRARIRK